MHSVMMMDSCYFFAFVPCLHALLTCFDFTSFASCMASWRLLSLGVCVYLHRAIDTRTKPCATQMMEPFHGGDGKRRRRNTKRRLSFVVPRERGRSTPTYVLYQTSFCLSFVTILPTLCLCFLAVSRATTCILHVVPYPRVCLLYLAWPSSFSLPCVFLAPLSCRTHLSTTHLGGFCFCSCPNEMKRDQRAALGPAWKTNGKATLCIFFFPCFF